MDILAKFGLPRYLKGKSLSEASALIAKKFEGRNSPDDVDTLNELQGRLRDAQEFIKSQQEALTKPGSASPQPPPQQAQQFDDGGDLDEENPDPPVTENTAGNNAEGDDATDAANGAANVVGGMGTAGKVAGVASAGVGMGIGIANAGKNIDKSGMAPPPEVPSVGSTVAKTAVAGAGAGAVFGPWGAAIGGVVGAGTGLAMGTAENKAAKKARSAYTNRLHHEATQEWASGGQMIANAYAGGGMLVDPTDPKKKKTAQKTNPAYTENVGGVNFTREGLDRTFVKNTPATFTPATKLNLGRFEGLDYFDVSNQGNTYNLAPTKRNIRGPEAYNDSIEEIKKLNPNAKFTTSGYIPMGSRKLADGGPLASDEELDDIEMADKVAANDKYTKAVLNAKFLDELELADKVAANDKYGATLPEKKGKIGSDDMRADKGDLPRGKFNPTELLRYSAPAMNAYQLATQKNPTKVQLARQKTTYLPQFVDEKSLQNIVQSAVRSNRNAILGASGGSGAAARSNLLASEAKGTQAMSKAYLDASEKNREERRRKQEFESRDDRVNIQQSNREIDANLEQQAAFESNKSKLLAQLGDDLGGIGEEELYKRFPELMGLSYDWRGEHIKTKEARKKARKNRRKKK